MEAKEVKIVLNIAEDLEKFYHETEKMSDFEYSVDEIFEEIIRYITDDFRVVDGLIAFGEDIKRCHAIENGFEDGNILAKAGMKLGMALYLHLKHLGLYSNVGLLAYGLDGWLDHRTPILYSIPVENSDDLEYL